VADDHHGRRPYADLTGPLSDVDERAPDEPLPRTEAVLYDRRRGVGRASVFDQLAGGLRQLAHAHEEHQRAVDSGQRGPVEALVPRHHGELLGEPALCHRDPSGGRYGDRAGHARHDFDRHAGLPARVDLLPAAAQDERVAALEPDDVVTGPSLLDQDLVDLGLGDPVVAGGLADVDDHDVGVQLVEQRARRQPIDYDDVGLGEPATPASRDQPRITGPATH
jgi:hypothetical protein